ncbi:MAG: hypothetical protein QMD96_05840 [Anaerosomatales bacterium]|nr:hypothetical protein [Anaerosomatales bacterium]
MDEEPMQAEDAVAFIDGLRLMLRDRPGFGWLERKLASLRRSVETLQSEADRMRAFLDERGLTSDYERWRARG